MIANILQLGQHSLGQYFTVTQVINSIAVIQFINNKYAMRQ